MSLGCRNYDYNRTSRLARCGSFKPEVDYQVLVGKKSYRQFFTRGNVGAGLVVSALNAFKPCDQRQGEMASIHRGRPVENVLRDGEDNTSVAYCLRQSLLECASVSFNQWLRETNGEDSANRMTDYSMQSIECMRQKIKVKVKIVHGTAHSTAQRMRATNALYKSSKHGKHDLCVLPTEVLADCSAVPASKVPGAG